MVGVALLALGWLGWRAWVPFGTVVAATVWVPGAALGDIDLRFVWQAVVAAAVYVADVALGDIDLHFA